MDTGTRVPIQLAGMVRQVQRQRLNPLDKSTVVSIWNRPVRIVKETMQPMEYLIPPGTYDSPSTLVVTSGSWWKNILDFPSQEIVVASPEVARSIVEDEIVGMLGASIGIADPGLFWLLGEVDQAVLKVKYKAELDAAKARQIQWYKNLIERADIDWSRTNGNPRSVNELQRTAAMELNLKGKPWMENVSSYAMVNCPACGFLRNPVYPICPNCKTNVDEFVKTKK